MLPASARRVETLTCPEPAPEPGPNRGPYRGLGLRLLLPRGDVLRLGARLGLRMCLRDLLRGGRATALMDRMVLAARDVWRALNVMQAYAIAALCMAVDLAPHDGENRELGEV